MLQSEGDLILIYYEDQPTIFARIESIEPDVKRHWYQVTLLVLSIPSQVVTWILREAYIDGTPFTMGGKAVRLEAVDRVKVERSTDDDHRREENRDTKAADKPGKIIPFKKS